MAKQDSLIVERIVSDWPLSLLWSITFHLTWVRAWERFYGWTRPLRRRRSR